MPDQTPPKSFPRLRRAPITEVVCGVVFDPVEGLDPLLLGVYWDERKDDFPGRQLHPALMDEGSLIIGAVPVRAMLTSSDEVFVLQLQHDRFFMNWRHRGGEYPRFSERHGKNGLQVRAERELATFRDFLKRRCGTDITAKRVELSKIDVLERDQHWSSLANLNDLLPVTSVFSEIQQAEEREVNLRFVERGSEGTVVIHITTLSDGKKARAVRIDARCTAKPDPNVHDAFVRSNAVLNDAFFKLIPSARSRFEADESEGGPDGTG